MPPFDLEQMLKNKPPSDVVRALSDASHKLLLPVDVDRQFLALLEVGAAPEEIVSQMQEYLAARAAALEAEEDAVGSAD